MCHRTRPKTFSGTHRGCVETYQHPFTFPNLQQTRSLYRGNVQFGKYEKRHPCRCIRRKVCTQRRYPEILNSSEFSQNAISLFFHPMKTFTTWSLKRPVNSYMLQPSSSSMTTIVIPRNSSISYESSVPSTHPRHMLSWTNSIFRYFLSSQISSC